MARPPREIVLALACLACNTANTPNLVGGCSATCSSGQVCFQNNCVSPCVAGGGTDCSGACVQLLTDQANCGSCGSACQSGLVCVNGSCAGNCGAGLALCAPDGGLAYCASLLGDRSNCGSCGVACATGAFCFDGGCAVPPAVCPPPQQPCSSGDGGSLCTNVQSDPANCGACNHPCDVGRDCVQAVCMPSCAPGLVHCGAATCVNLQDDPSNCGQCGAVCEPNGFCAQGSCHCAAGYTDCGAAAAPQCLLLLSDPDNCGGCGARCQACEICEGGACTARSDIFVTSIVPLLSSQAVAIAVTIGDFNGDGVPDLAAAVGSSGNFDQGDQIQIFFGDGGGGFSTSTSIPADPSVYFNDVRKGDFNGDGYDDLVVGTVPSDAGVLIFPGFIVLYGQSDGGFVQASPQMAVPIGTNAGLTIELRAEDLNGDGRSDVARLSDREGLFVFYSLADGGFSSPQDAFGPQVLTATAQGFDFYTGLDASDVNGDGLTDLTITALNAAGASGVLVFLQASNGFYFSAANPAAWTAAPVVGDQIINVLSYSDIGAYRFADAGLVLLSDTATVGGGPYGIALDLNGDGVDDLVAGSSVYLGRDGGGVYGTPALLYLFTAYGDFARGDLNGDGRIDLVQAQGSTGLAVFLNNCVPGSP
jgi:hypothetical protein